MNKRSKVNINGADTVLIIDSVHDFGYFTKERDKILKEQGASAPREDSSENQKSDKDLKGSGYQAEQTYDNLFYEINLHKVTTEGFSSENADQISAALKVHRFIIIDSPLDDVNADWCSYLVKHTGCAKTFSVLPDKYENQNIFTLIAKKERTTKEEEAIIIHLELSYLTKLAAFLTDGSVHRYTLMLKQQSRYVIFRFCSDTVTPDLKIRQRMAESIYFQVDFVEAFLRKRISSELVAGFTASIKHQALQGLWGESKEDGHSFFRELKSALENLADEIALRKKFEGGGYASAQEFRKSHVEKVKVEDLVPVDDSAKKTLLLIVAFFENLPLHDVLSLTRFLITVKESREPRLSTPVQETPKKPQKKHAAKTRSKVNEDKNEKSSDPVPVSEDKWYWSDKVFRESFLTVITHSTMQGEVEGEVVDFSIPYLRKRLRIYFEKQAPIYLLENFRDILQADILMFYDTSRSLREGFIRLLAAMVAKDPENYAPSLLWDIVRRFKIKNLELSLLSNEPDQDVTFELFVRRKKALQMEGDIYLLVSRLAELIKVMFEYSHLQKMTDSFFESLLATDGLATLLVLQILEEVQSASRNFHAGFEMLKWLKKIMANQQNGQLRDRAYHLLQTMALYSEDKLPEIINAVENWKRESVRNNEIIYPGLYEVSHRFVFDLCLSSIRDMDYALYGRVPTLYPLFSPIFYANKQNSKYLDRLMIHLFDPNLIVILWAATSDHEQDSEMTYARVYWDTQYLLAAVVEEWFLILRYVRDKQADGKGEIQKETACNITVEEKERAAAATYKVLTSILKAIPRYQRNWLLNRWRWKWNSYLHHANQLQREGRKQERAWIKTRKLFLGELIREFSAIKIQ